MNIAILGATWAVWKEMVSCLKNKNISVKNLKLLSSARSAGKVLNTEFWDITVEEENEKSFENVDFALFSAWWDVSKKWAKIAISSWAIVVDNSSAFRYEDDVPLVIPQINGGAIWDAKLIANPNCTTAIAAMALFPIHKKYKIEKAIISTYQATSGAGAKWMQELLDVSKQYLDWKWLTHDIFVHPIAFNIIPHIDSFQKNWYTKEEMKMAWETRKIFQDDSIQLSCTAVRIPTLRAHSEAITLQTKYDINPDDVKQLLKSSPWVELVDALSENSYPMPIYASWKYDILVGRIRQSLVFGPKWLDLFISWDQLLRWAALNAVEIVQFMIKTAS